MGERWVARSGGTSAGAELVARVRSGRRVLALVAGVWIMGAPVTPASSLVAAPPAVAAPPGMAQEPNAGAPPEAAQAPGWDDFPAFVWRFERGTDERALAPARAFGGSNLLRGEDGSALARAGIPFVVDNVAGRNELHLDRDAEYTRRFERWYASRDERELVRSPCLEDPAVRERMLATLRRTLESPGAPFALGFSLGDEVSFTPYGSPEDTCLCERCAALWREFLTAARARGRTSLPADLPLARASTDAARLALESGAAEPIEAWLLRREFTQERMQRVLAELAAAARALRPDARLGLTGMIGRTAFGGVAVDRVLPRLDFAECYRVGDARELLFTLRGPSQRVVQTVFVDGESPAAAAWFAWESWLRGADGLVIWSDRDLAAHPAAAEALRAAVDAIRATRSAAGAHRPAPRGVAIVNDEDSIAYGWLVDARLDGPTWPRRLQGYQEEKGSRERTLRAWLRLFEDCGALPGAVPLATVGRATVERFPLLVLNHLRVLDAAGLARILEFLEAGGRVVVAGELGAIDRRGARPATPPLEALRARLAARVSVAPADLERYAVDRLHGGAARREWATALAVAAGVPLAPFTLRHEGEPLPWLRVFTELPDGAVIGAALPSAPIEALGAREVEIEPRGAFRVTRLHPRGPDGTATRLAPGEALVFRLEPVR